MISKISTEISKKEERRGLFSKKTTPKYHEPETAAEVQGWGEDEFDDEEFDDDYESPYSGDEEGSGGDYESPNDDLDGSNDYEPPPSEPPEDMVHKLCPTLPIGDGDYIVAPGPPQIFRGNKPGRDSGSNPSPVRGPHRNTTSDKLLNTTPSLSTIKVYPRALDFRDPLHAMETAVAEQRNFTGSDRQSVRPSPSTARTQDGAYLVRDSTRQLANQPYTLMVFYQDKVYNIQIRQQNQQFLLGTGLKVQESFPSVSGIIGHYSQSPLLLIDAKNRSSSQQNQCLLSDPAGYYMTGHKWP
ncbi:Lymphocyte cytosolic protein 2 [Nibea albiflora]|uniref:Lymphocyte cytosolic protein 2 n=1 Tax=Nibea albiflora TaxID=240163 RepID=A0ACB7F2H2_NIBAL|nr:Lymphocyte cytosolic protein 2 [Nibea albiflora]